MAVDTTESISATTTTTPRVVKRSVTMEGSDVEEPSMSGASTPRYILTMSQLLLLNAIVCGLEFCASAAFCYIPPMLLKAGINEENMSMILGVGPLLGFFLVPVIGRSSDKCRSRWGRRRPFIFILSILLILSLIIIPFGEILGVYMFGRGVVSKSIGVGMLVVGAVLLDFTSQACLTPCEALLSDACKNTNQQDRCFTVYSFMVSLGGIVGYLITALDWSNSYIGIMLGSQERSAFSVLIILFTLSMLATLTTAHEHPQEISRQSPVSEIDTQLQRKLDQVHKALIDQKGLVAPVTHHDPGYETGSNQSLTDEYMHMNGMASLGATPESDSSAKGKSSLPLIACPLLTVERHCNIPLTRLSTTNCTSLMHLVKLRIYTLLPESIQNFFNVPLVLKRLAVANCVSWTAVMSFNLFYTDFVGQVVYGGDPNAPENSHLQELYDEGVRMGSWGLLYHCITSAIYSIFIEKLVMRFGTRMTYFLGMFSFTMAMSVMALSRTIWLVNSMAAMTGFAYATMTTIPFILVTQYHSDKEVFFADTRDPVDGKITNRGTATDMAVLDSAYFLSQVVLTAFMGYIVHYTGTVVAYMVVAGFAGAISCTLILRIIFTRKQMWSFVNTSEIRKNVSF